MTYEPHPSTIAYRVIEYLKTQPTGKAIGSGPLADAMGQPSSAVITALTRCVEHGLIKKERVDGFFVWSLGDGVPLTKPAGHDDDPPKQVISKAPRRVKAPEHAKPISAQVTDDTRWGDSAPSAPSAFSQALVPLDDDFVYTWSSSGELTITKAGVSVVLTPADREKLQRFLSALTVLETQS